MDKSPPQKILRSNTERFIQWLIENPSKWRVPTYRRIEINKIRPIKKTKKKTNYSLNIFAHIPPIKLIFFSK